MRWSIVSIIICAAVLVVAGVAAFTGIAQAQVARLLELPTGQANARAGACSFPAGGWTIVDCSDVAAARSGQLNAYSRFVVQCGANSYVAWGSSSVVADGNDGFVPSGAWLEFVTSYDARYFSCLNIGGDSDCRIIECL